MEKLIAVAAGREKADLILKNLNIVNVLSGNIEKGDIAISGGVIVGIGNYDNSDNICDCNGKYAMPGFIDSHVHIESTHLTPFEFARTVVPCGTTTVIADPHEIANVSGLDGIRYIYEESKSLPLDVKIMFPSCVPATPFETSGAQLTSEDMDRHLGEEMFFGVGEFMNYPAVIGGDGEALSKLKAAKKYGKHVDGHSGGVSGKALNAYIAAGIKTDHECVTLSDMLEKLDRGMYIQVRQGSATKNLEELIKGITPYNIRRCLLCTDDKTPYDLITDGHIDNSIRLAVKCGMTLVYAVSMATINAAECYGLKDRGALAPGYKADIVLCRDLNNLNIDEVYKNGVLVAKDKKPLFTAESKPSENLLNTVKIREIVPEDFKLKLSSDTVKAIKLIKGNVVTEKSIRKVSVIDGCFAGGEGLSKLAVLERHKGTGNIGLGILEGYGIKNGAVAVTVAHDSHNIIIAGDNDEDMAVAANSLKECGGGLVIVSGKKVLKLLPLEIAGLISTKTAKEFSEEYDILSETAYAMGVNRGIEPFMSLSFMSLSVIPHLKLTDMGLFDVDTFAFTDTEA